ncbi:putative F-box domain-containing protein [Seiridium unicorne]|uniref:F-box domain-containing protein n=1 Tax=Seiridium unicorne TaxID=138068 RepID=A0ABR2UGI3_9PEZI
MSLTGDGAAGDDTQDCSHRSPFNAATLSDVTTEMSAGQAKDDFERTRDGEVKDLEDNGDHDNDNGQASDSIALRPNSFLTLPSELIDTILGSLSPLDLTILRQVCKALYVHADNEFHWQRHVWSNLPGNPITSPYPFKTFRELYASHDPFWFIPKHKVWFSDRGLAGQMIIVQYDQRRGVIEGYQLVGVNNSDSREPWFAHDQFFVQIEHFEPEVKLHRDKPVVKLDPVDHQARGDAEAESTRSTPRRQFFPAQPMSLDTDTDPRVGEVILAKPIGGALEENIPVTFPYGYVWPPPTIPARHRVGAQAAGVLPISSQRLEVASPGNWSPSCREEASDHTFRIRRWMEWARQGLGLRLGEETVTWSTLDPYYYTPTKEKPWRGIWVGDYNLHGCEFLLLHQPDSANDDTGPLEREVDETDDEFENRFLLERVYKGSLEAVKLTGDMNVPRGELSFIVPDLGEHGFVGVQQEPPFEGCRIARSRGHIAHDGFVNDTFISSEIIFVSPNRLAQLWLGFQHVSYYERVDIDRFLVP